VIKKKVVCLIKRVKIAEILVLVTGCYAYCYWQRGYRIYFSLMLFTFIRTVNFLCKSTFSISGGLYDIQL
jgi:hypothetical protein